MKTDGMTLMKGMFVVLCAASMGFVGLWACGDKSGGHDEVDAAVDAEVVDAEVQEDAEIPDPDCGIDATEVYDDVATLAAPQWEGRKPGTAGNLAAMDMVETLFTDLGLMPAGVGGTYRQPFAYNQWDILEMPSLTLESTPLAVGTEFIVFNYSGTGNATAEMVFVGHGMTIPSFNPVQYPNCPLGSSGYDDYDSIDATGKIALVMRHGPADDEDIHDYCPANAACVTPPCPWLFGYKAANAKLHGAVGMILVQDYYHAGDVETALTLSEGYFDADFPAVMADRSRVEEVVPDMPTWAGTINNTLAPASATTGATAIISVSAGVAQVQTENVLGSVPGTDPTLGDEVVIIGAHIDHLGVDTLTNEAYLGADDNASGIAVMMELARMTACATEPARTVLFAAFNAEEVGLIGSCYYVDNPTYVLANTKLMVSIDMVGAGDGSGLIVFGGSTAGQSWVVDLMQGSATAQGLTYSVVAADPNESSDHACFVYAFVPAVHVLTLGPHDYYHTPGDTIDTILTSDLEAASLLMWALLEPLVLGIEDIYLPNSLGFKRAPLDRPLDRPQFVPVPLWARNR